MTDAHETAKSWRTIQAVETSTTILRALRELDGAGVTELSDHLNIAKGTVHSHLATLCKEELVVKNGDTYHLGLQFLDFGTHAKDRIGNFDILREELDTLAADTEEVVQFMTEEYGRGVYLYKARGDRSIETASYVGQRIGLHCTGLGKAILSQLPTSRVEQIVDRHGLPPKTANTCTELSELLTELETVRERGYSTDDEEILRGLRCVAAPVVEPNGDLLGAVSIAGPTGRMNGERFTDELPELIKSTANVIEINTAQRSRQ